jgi:hypothetical protein
VDGERIRLLPELPNTHEGFEGIPEELVPVPWGARRYLVPSGEIRSFCNAVNSGREPRGHVHGRFFFREGDDERPVAGLPALPEGFEGCLLDRPIRARVLKVGVRRSPPPADGEPEAVVFVVTLGAGRAQGVWDGMVFHVERPAGTWARATVVRTRETTAEAEIEEWAPSEEERTPPAVGWRLSTRAPR